MVTINLYSKSKYSNKTIIVENKSDAVKDISSGLYV